MVSYTCRSFEETIAIFSSVLRVMSYDEFLWAWHVTNTRCVSMKQPSLSDVRTTPQDLDDFALAPFLDLLNHSPTAQVNYLNMSYREHTGFMYQGYISRTQEIYRTYGLYIERENMSCILSLLGVCCDL